MKRHPITRSDIDRITNSTPVQQASALVECERFMADVNLVTAHGDFPDAWKKSDLAASPNIPEGYISAHKTPDGSYRLVFIGTDNDVFAGLRFPSWRAAYTFFRQQKLNARQLTTIR